MTKGNKVVEKVEPVLIMGTIPCMNDLIRAAWGLCREPSELLAKMAGYEYEAYDVFRALWFGHAHFYMAYMSDDAADIEFAGKSVENANLIVAKYVTLKKEKDWVGFTAVRLDEKSAHVWQAYLTDKYRGTDAFDKCAASIEQGLGAIGVPGMTFTTMRRGMGERVEKMGYTEGMTTYFKPLAKKEESNLLV